MTSFCSTKKILHKYVLISTQSATVIRFLKELDWNLRGLLMRGTTSYGNTYANTYEDYTYGDTYKDHSYGRIITFLGTNAGKNGKREEKEEQAINNSPNCFTLSNLVIFNLIVAQG